MISKTKIASLAAAASSVALASPAYAAGLDKAQSFTEQLKDQLTLIIPVVAGIAMLVLAGMYGAGMARKETIFNWFVGVILAGSATEIVALFFT